MRSNEKQIKVVMLVLLVTIAIEGQMAKAGSLVELTEDEAKPLLARGAARLATAEDGVDVPQDDDQDGAEKLDDLKRHLEKLNKADLLAHAQAGGLLTVTDENTKPQILDAILAAAAAQVKPE